MALTYSIAGAQTQLDAIDTALRAGSWSDAYAALASYRLIRAGLADSASGDGASHTLPDPAKLADAIRDAKAFSAEIATQGRRLGRARVRHG